MPAIHRPRETPRYTYEPDPSVTAHELARLVPVLVEIGNRTPLSAPIDGYMWGQRIEDLEDDLRRHFQPPREDVTV